MSRSESIKELAAALAAAQGSFPPIVKNKTAKVPMKAGGQYSYKYADLSEIFDCIMPTLSKNGLAITQSPTMDAAHGLILETTIMHSSGEWVSGLYPLNKKERPQEMGSEISYAKRYTITSMLGIQADDTDASSHTVDAIKGHRIDDQKERIEHLKQAAKQPPKNFAPGSADTPWPDERDPGPNDPEDSFYPQPEDAMPSDLDISDLKNYKVSFGKFTGKSMSEIGLLEGRKYIDWLLEDAQKKGKPLNENAVRFQTMYHRFSQLQGSNK